jgi:hypothetical protein
MKEASKHCHGATYFARSKIRTNKQEGLTIFRRGVVARAHIPGVSGNLVGLAVME